MKAALFHIDHLSQEERIMTSFEDDLCLGKSEHANVQIPDWKCSGIHAYIKRMSNNKFSLIDLGSYYGTSVNDVQVKEIPLENGDFLTIG